MKNIWVDGDRMTKQWILLNSVPLHSGFCFSEAVTQLMWQTPFNCLSLLCSWADLLLPWLGIKAPDAACCELFFWGVPRLFPDLSWCDSSPYLQTEEGSLGFGWWSHETVAHVSTPLCDALSPERLFRVHHTACYSNQRWWRRDANCYSWSLSQKSAIIYPAICLVSSMWRHHTNI